MIAPAVDERRYSSRRNPSLVLLSGWLVGSLCRTLHTVKSRQRALPSGHSCGESIRTCGRLAESCRRWGVAWRVPLSFYTQNVGAGVGRRALSLTTSQTAAPLLTRPFLAVSSSSFFPRTGLATREGKSTLQGLVFQPSQSKNDSRSYLLTTASPCCCFCRLRRLLLIVCACVSY